MQLRPFSIRPAPTAQCAERAHCGKIGSASPDGWSGVRSPRDFMRGPVPLSMTYDDHDSFFCEVAAATIGTAMVMVAAVMTILAFRRSRAGVSQRTPGAHAAMASTEAIDSLTTRSANGCKLIQGGRRRWRLLLDFLSGRDADVPSALANTTERRDLSQSETSYSMLAIIARYWRPAGSTPSANASIGACRAGQYQYKVIPHALDSTIPAGWGT